MSLDITELQSIDIALGAVIAHAFDGLALHGSKNYQEFLSRPTTEKVLRAEHEDGLALIKRISSAEKGAVPENPKQKNRPPRLPIVGYYRKVGLSNGDEVARAFNQNLWDESALKSLKLSILPVSLDYSMTFAAMDKPTLDKMQLAWYHYIAQPARKNSRFIVPSRIGDEIIDDIPANILDPRSIIFTDTSPDKAEVGRLFSVSTDITVVTHVVVGENVAPLDEITVHGILSRYFK